MVHIDKENTCEPFARYVRSICSARASRSNLALRTRLCSWLVMPQDNIYLRKIFQLSKCSMTNEILWLALHPLKPCARPLCHPTTWLRYLFVLRWKKLQLSWYPSDLQNFYMHVFVVAYRIYISDKNCPNVCFEDKRVSVCSEVHVW